MLFDKGWRYPVDRLDSDVMWNDMVRPSLLCSGSVHVGIQLLVVSAKVR